MKAITFRLLPFWTSLLCLAPQVRAQAPAAAAPPADASKPPVHKADQSALNRLKQDDRAKKDLSEALEKLREAHKRNEAADKEIKRVNARDLKEDPGKVIDSMKDQLSPEDTAALKEVVEKSKAALNNEDVKKVIEDARKKAAATANSKPKTPTTTPPQEKPGPTTFDQVPAPVPVVAEPPGLKEKKPRSVVDGDTIILPPTQDPANPGRALPPSDPRSRTYVVIGNAQVKTPNMVLDADRIEVLASQDGEGGGAGIASMPGKKPAKPAKPNAVDPVQPGAGEAAEEKKAAPFDRVIATGRVNIVRIVNGKTQSGKGGSMIYDRKTDEMILTDWPEAQEGNQIIVGTRKDARIILVPKGRTRFEGCTLRDLGDGKMASAGTSTPPPPAPAPAAAPPRAVPVR